MIIDSSAIIAVLLKEPESGAIARVLAMPSLRPCFIAAPTLLETGIVIHGRKQEAGMADLSQFIASSQIITVAFTPELADLALISYHHFYKPPARLNFGDCFSYALAKARNEPLLCKGDDFKNTDLQLVEY